MLGGGSGMCFCFFVLLWVIVLYRWPSLFANFLSAVSLIRGPGKHTKIQYLRSLPRLFAFFLKEFGLKMAYKWLFSSIQCSLIIHGFSIRGTLMERIYRELRGKPVIHYNASIRGLCSLRSIYPQFRLSAVQLSVFSHNMFTNFRLLLI